MSLLSLDNLTVHIGGVTPVDGVTLSIGAGERYVLLGESGSGKSMTALAIMRLLPSGGRIVSGDVRFDGQSLPSLPESGMRRLRGSGMAMIFQEPQTSLNPVMTIGDQIAEALPHGLSKTAQRAEVIRLLDEVGIPNPKTRLHSYPFELSGGQKQRAMIAQALAGQPKLLIADEPTTALDVTLQAQILELIKRLARERGMALLMITHDLGVARHMADTVGIMYAGQLVETLPIQEGRGLKQAFHPYTRKLMEAVPGLNRAGTRLAAIPGRVPPLDQPFQGCRFVDRCDQAFSPCTGTPPAWTPLGEGHAVRCHLTQVPAERRSSIEADAAMPAPGNDTVLNVRDLAVTFAQRTGQLFGKKHIHAVDGISFDLARGETLALVGESGCGKTTAAKAILGLVPVTRGEVVLDGQRISGLSERQFKPHRKLAQIVFQDPYSSLNPRMRVGDILAEGMIALGVATPGSREEAIVSLLEKVGLARDAMTRYPHEFSGGQRQRIAIARALAVKPRVLVCDEPTSALDVSVQAQILNLLADLQRDEGLSMLFITHNLAAVGYLAHRVAVMKEGKIVETGTTHDILTRPQHPYTQGLLAAVV